MSDSPAPLAERRVREAIETLYHLFEAPPPKGITGCPCCLSTRRTDVLLTTALRRIRGQDLWRYVSGVYLTVGSDRDFRYLLPRILEVSAIDPREAINPEIVLGKLQLANWRSWRPDEQRAIEAFIDAWFEQALAGDLAEAEAGWIGNDAESVLCGAGRAKMSLERWLVRLREPFAAPVLADLRQRFPRHLSAFWDRDSPAFQELAAILV